MFANPIYLNVIPIIALALILVLLRTKFKKRKKLQEFANTQNRVFNLKSYSPTRSRIKNVLLLFSILLVFVSLARPQWGHNWKVTPSQNMDVVFILDVSRSMQVQDVFPNRLARAQQVIKEVSQNIQDMNLGLIVYAKDPFLQCPVTHDYRAFLESVDFLNTDNIRQGSNMANALSLLSQINYTENHTQVVLISDGEDFSNDLQDQLRYLQSENITIHSICIGTFSGGLIPGDSGGQDNFFMNSEGQAVNSSADPSALQQITRYTGGYFWHIKNNASNPQGVVRALREPIELSSQTLRVKIPKEYYQTPLIFAWILLCFEFAMGNRRLDALT